MGFVIENGFTYIAFLMFLCGGLLALQKYCKWKIFNIVPPLVWIYLIGMICCTAGMFNSEGVSAAYGALIDEGAYGCALALDTVCYSVWIALLLLAVKFAPKWNKATQADTSKLDALAAAANAEVAKEQKRATSADWIFIIGIGLIASVVCQKLGAMLEAFLETTFIGNLFGTPTCITVIVTILGLICAMTPMGKLPAIEELSNVLLYAVVAMLATQAPLNALLDAPMWVVYGMLILVVHVALMFLLSKVFHWDLCMVSTASVANIGGSASAPIIACAYDSTFAGIGILMGVLGAAVGNFFGMGMGAILRLLV